jgi:hypothetical protein
MKYNVGDRIKIREGSLHFYQILPEVQSIGGFLTVSDIGYHHGDIIYGFVGDGDGHAHWLKVEENSDLYPHYFSKPKVDPTTLPNYYPPVPIRITPYFIFIFIMSLFYRRDLLCLVYRMHHKVYLTLGKRINYFNWKAPVHWWTGVGDVVGNEISGRISGRSTYIDDIILIKRYDKRKFNESSRYKFKTKLK